MAIGGITLERVGEVRRAGARGVAVISAVVAAPEMERAARAFTDALSRSD